MESEKEILEAIDGLVAKLELLRKQREERKYPIWEELDRVSGYFIDNNSNIMEAKVMGKTSERNQNIYIDEAHVKSALAMAKISQLMSYYGGRVTDEEWKSSDIKYIICRGGGNLTTVVSCNRWHPIAFHTEEQRAAFVSRRENIQLLKDYFMMD